MPFEQAKQNFETKTQKAPEKVEGNWDQFKTDTKDYYNKKLKEVRDYIDKANYQGSEADKSNYLKEMSRALDDVIDGNEATKKEMDDYKTTLNSKSDVLKNKFEMESTKSELYYGVGKGFESVGLKLDVTDNVKTYLSVPWAQRLPLNYIKDFMGSIFKSQWNSDEALKYLNANGNVLYTVLNYLCRGDKDQAEAKSKPIIENLKFIDLCNQTRAKIDIVSGLQTKDVMFMLSSLVHVGINQDKVSDFFLKNLDKLRKLDKENFDTILLKYPTSELPKFLLSGIIAVSEGKTLQATEGIKLTLQIESATLKKRSEVESKSGQLQGFLKDEIDELNKYREKNPQIQVDKEISRLEKDVAQTKFGLIFCMQELTLAEAKRELANSCLDVKGVDPSSAKTKQLVNDILNAKLSVDLEGIIVKNGLKRAPKQLAVLQATELQMELARQEYNEKKDIDDNREITNGKNTQNVINEFYKTGELKGEGRSMYQNEYEKQVQNLKKILDQFSSAADNNQTYFNETISKKYKSISEVSPSEAQTVVEKLTGQMALLKSLFGASAKYIGVLESRLSITTLAETKKEIQDEIKDCKSKAEEYASQFNNIGKFLGVKEDKYLKGKEIDDLVRAPIAIPLLQKEIAPYHNKLNQLCNNIAQVSTPLNYIGKIIQEQAERNDRFLPYQFDRGIGMIDNVVSAMQSARTTLLDDRADLNRQMLGLKDSEKYDKLPDSIKFARKKVLENLINQIDDLLNKKITTESIGKLKDASADLITKRDQTIKYKAWSGVATTFIFCSAIGLAVIGGIGAGALGAKLFTSGTVASNLGMGTLSMTGVAAGGVLGSRGAMQVGSWLDIGDYGGWKKIWNTKDMAKEFALGFALSVAAVGSAKLLVKGLSKAAKSEELALRFPGFSKFSKTALDKLDGVSRFASPSTWFEGAEVAGTSAAGNQARRNFLRQFGNQTKEELYQESMEEAAGRVNKTAEFLVSLASATKGGARLRVHGLQAKSVGIAVEGNNLTYTTKTAQEFVRDFKNGNPGEINTDYKIKINSDNSVTIELMSGKIDPKTGVSKIYSVIDVKPAMEIGNITADVEFARVRGLTVVDGKPNVYTVQDAEQGLDVLGDFYSRGFNVVKTEAGNIKVSKGDKSIEIVAPTGMMAMLNIKSEAELTEAAKSRSALKYLKDNVVKIKEYLSNINVKKSFEEFITKWQGNYAKFLENNPRLANLMPGDLKQLAMVSGAVIAAITGVPIALGLVQQVQSLEYEPGQRLYVKFGPGDFRYLDVQNIDPSTGMMTVYDWKLQKSIGYNMKVLNGMAEEHTVEINKAQELALRLNKIGLIQEATEIASLEVNNLSSIGTDISTIKMRENVVKYLEGLYSEMRTIEANIKNKGYENEVLSIMDFKNNEYKSLISRYDAIRNLDVMINSPDLQGKILPEGIALIKAIEQGNLVQLIQSGELHQRIPELGRLFGEESYQHGAHKFEKIGAHTLEVLQNLRSSNEYKRLVEKNPENRQVLELAALFHDIGKRGYAKDHPQRVIPDNAHEAKCAEVAEAALKKLNLPPHIVGQVVKLVRFHSAGSEMALKNRYPDTPYNRDNLTPQKLAAELKDKNLVHMLMALNFADAQSINDAIKVDFINRTRDEMTIIYEQTLEQIDINANVENKLAEFSQRLQTAEFHEIANDIANPEIYYIVSLNADISTLEKREALVMKLEKFKEDIEWISDCGFGKEASEISDFNNNNYKSIGERFAALAIINSKLNYFPSKGINLQPQNARALIDIFEFKGEKGQLAKNLFKKFNDSLNIEDGATAQKAFDELKILFEPIFGKGAVQGIMPKLMSIGTEKLALDVNFNLKEFETFCKTDNDKMLLEVFKNEFGNREVKLSDESIRMVTEAASFNTPELNPAAKLRLFIKIKVKERAIREDSSLSEQEKTEQLQQIAECKEMLRDGKIGRELNHGTNSYIFDALKEGNPELLSGGELKRRGIIAKSGEKDVGGGDAETDRVSAGQNIDGLGTARAYARLNGTSEGYKNPIHFSIELLQQRIQEFKVAIQNIEQKGLGKYENLFTLEAVKRLHDEYSQALVIKMKDPRAGQKEPYQIIFGLKKGNLASELVEDRRYGGGLSGEVNVLTPSIKLKEHLKVVYVPRENIQEARAQLVRLFGKEKATKIKVYSIESLDMMGDLMGSGNVYNSAYEATYSVLNERVETIIHIGTKML